MALVTRLADHFAVSIRFLVDEDMKAPDADEDLARIAIEEVGADAARLAEAILKQLPGLTGAIPIYGIARALDIEEIREEPLNSFEGCLVTDRQRATGRTF